MSNTRQGLQQATKITSVKFAASVMVGKESAVRDVLSSYDQVDGGPISMSWSEHEQFMRVHITKSGVFHVIPLHNVASMRIEAG